MFKEGRKKTGGRKKGSKNKKTEVANAFVRYLLGKGYDDWDDIWAELKAREKADVMMKGLEYEIPKQARVENTNKLPSSVTINFIPATPERLAEQNTIDIEHEEIRQDNSD